MLADELRAFGAADVVEHRAGVGFRGALEVAYRACLWSRVASRVLLPLATFPAPSPAELYAGVRAIRWRDHLSPRGTLAVDCATGNAALSHSHYAALKTKDAIVDQFREATGERPSVDVRRPDVRVNVYLTAAEATVSLDLSGESLHRRAYREARGAAPLKETVAAAVLLLADWPRRARSGAPLVDPMCGAGTLPIEAALMAADIAPGRARSHFGFLRWRGHDPGLWTRLCAEADARAVRDPKRVPPIHGYDADGRVVRAALANVEHAGVRGLVHIEKRELDACAPIAPRRGGESAGLLVVNPPYGQRLGDAAGLGELYARLGDLLRRRFLGWTGYVLTGNPALGRRIGLRPARRHVLYNGAIECRLLELPISSEPVREDSRPHWRRDT